MEASGIRALDAGVGGWFRVDVVLRPAGPVGGHDDQRLVQAVSGDLPLVDGPEHGRDPSTESSYDISPPEGDLGVGLWVRAPTIGSAVDAATSFVLRCAADVGQGAASVWDVRALPHEAVGVSEPPAGTQQVISSTKVDPASS